MIVCYMNVQSYAEFPYAQMFSMKNAQKSRTHALQRAVHYTFTQWLSDIGRMAEVRNVPHLARCEYRRIGLFLIIEDV